MSENNPSCGASPFSTPNLILVFGLPGVGKSTLAHALAEKLPAIVVSTEHLRSQLFEISAEPDDRDFSQEEQRLTYRALLVLSKYLLIAGHNVIAEGVFRSNEQRHALIELGRTIGCHLISAHVTCSDATAVQRLLKRKSIGTISPASERTYWMLKRDFNEADSSAIIIDTDTIAMSDAVDMLRKVAKPLLTRGKNGL